MSDSQDLKFHNEPPTDFSVTANRQAMETALAHVRSQLGLRYPVVINGKHLDARSTFKSVNPSKPQETVGLLQNADRKLADRALAAATKSFPAWSAHPAWKRAEVLRQMAKALRERKFEFCSWLIYEVG